MKVHNTKNYLERRRELRKSSTPEEVIFWKELRNNKLGVKFKRQHSIGGYILDFYCFQARLIIEIDGKSHDTNKLYDADRDKYFKELGYVTLRIKNTEIQANLNDVKERIKKTLSLRLGEGAPTQVGAGEV